MDASDQPTTPPRPPATEPAPAAPAPQAPQPQAPQPPAPPPPVPPTAFAPVAAPTPWRRRRWVRIVGAIAAALVLLGVGWTAGYTMGGGNGGNRHSQYDNGPFGNRRGFDGQRGFPGPQFGPRHPFGPPGQQKNQPTPQPTPSKSG